MREILFRGKAIDGNWYYGVPLVFAEDVILIAAPHTYSKNVETSTIGQYTGLTDNNGTKIFEGDIVKGKDHLEKDLEVYGFIDHKNGSFVIVGDFMTHYRWLDYDVEVIGNIHDNPELLKEREG